VAANLALIFVSRSRSESLVAVFVEPNRIYWLIVATAGLILGLAIGVQGFPDLFRFSRRGPRSLWSSRWR